MTAEHFKKVALAGLRSSFDSHTKAFTENPTSDNFASLERSMYALQYAAKRPAQDVQDLIGELGCGLWEQHICSHVLRGN